MRPIKFRGRIINGIENAGQWVYWGVGGTDLIDVIDPETIGQFTGLLDSQGVEIYENDVVKIREPDEDSCSGNEFEYKAKVIWKRHQWMFDDGVYRVLGVYGWTEYSTLSSMSGRCEFEVIGNIHQNPELLK